MLRNTSRRIIPLAVSSILGLLTTEIPPAHAAPAASPDPEPWLKASPEVMKRWDDLTFGMFIHWDMSSVLGVEISWHRKTPMNGPIPDEVYDNLYKKFDPEKFDAKAIVQTAKDAGMRYIIFTAKHHGGFCMFGTKLTDYNIMNTPFHRDIVGELADAAHKAGIVFGIYYSQPDWHNAAFMAKDWDAYNPYFYGQMSELCSKYGKIGMIFFDGVSYGSTQYKPKELFKMIRELQPDVVINNRCGLPADYDTPEQVIGAFKTDRPWETNMTLGTSWSWKVNDKLKPAKECIRKLVMTVGSGGNFLLNVGPMATGEIEPRQVVILKEVGDWLKTNGEAIYALHAGPYKPAGWGACTSKGNILYLHILSWEDSPPVFPKIPAKIASVTRLDGRPVKFTQDESGFRFDVPESERDAIDTILKVTLAPGSPMTEEIKPILVATRSLARFKPVSASHAPEMAARLVDDDPGTQWVPGERQCWAEIDLGTNCEFRRIDIREEGNAWERRTKDFELLARAEGASEDDWKTIDKGTSIGSNYTKTFEPITSRYVRLKINDSGALPRFSEIQIYK